MIQTRKQIIDGLGHCSAPDNPTPTTTNLDEVPGARCVCGHPMQCHDWRSAQWCEVFGCPCMRMREVSP